MGKNTASTVSSVSRLIKALCLVAVLYFVVRCIDATSDNEIRIEPTPIVIESVKPIGELYAYTAITEDYYIDNIESLGYFTRNYSKAVQTLRMQVSFVMNLDSVVYERREGTDTVVVKLPPLRYIQSSQGGMLLSEAEVRMESFNADKVLNLVEHKIRRDYDTAENRLKAMAHAKEVLSSFVAQFGFVAVFEER